jgi:hypothetical protein
MGNLLSSNLGPGANPTIMSYNGASSLVCKYFSATKKHKLTTTPVLRVAVNAAIVGFVPGHQQHMYLCRLSEGKKV